MGTAYKLVKSGDIKELYADDDVVATWDKHDSWDHCVRQAEKRLQYSDDVLVQEVLDDDAPVEVTLTVEEDVDESED